MRVSDNPVPALLEYIPYRKRDMTRGGDEPKHSYFAGHGYASVRVDMAGAGDSFGVMRDEYARQELSDGKEIIAWLARQSWCNGKCRDVRYFLGRFQFTSGSSP